MLYVTTRSDADAFTPHRVLVEKRGKDGGLYIPMRIPVFSAEDMDRFAGKRFSDTVAELINLQFGSKLTSWDVDLALGRYPVRLKKLSHRIYAAECWHNTRGYLDRLTENIAPYIDPELRETPEGDWLPIGVRIAILFGIYGELNRAGIANGQNPFDISVVSGDFISPISAWYARKFGLPIGNIICCCNENSGVWNFLSHGQLRTGDSVVSTSIPNADVVAPEGLERLIRAVADPREAAVYRQCLDTGATYYLPNSVLPRLREAMLSSVVSQTRTLSTVSNCFASMGYVMSPYDGLCHAGLLDYRSRTGIGRPAVILSEYSPELDIGLLTRTLDRPEAELRTAMNTQ